MSFARLGLVAVAAARLGAAGHAIVLFSRAVATVVLGIRFSWLRVLDAALASQRTEREEKERAREAISSESHGRLSHQVMAPGTWSSQSSGILPVSLRNKTMVAARAIKNPGQMLETDPVCRSKSAWILM